MDEPAKTVIPASDRSGVADAPAAVRDAQRTTAASNERMRENRNGTPFYAVNASSAFEAWSIVSAGGNESVNALPPLTAEK
jgi:hypothetical protein